MEKLNPELFTWDNYEYDYGARLGLDFRESTEMRIMEREIKKRGIGYCDGSRLSVRPKNDMYGLMLEDDEHEKFWFHFPKSCLDNIMSGIDWDAIDKMI